MTHDESQHPRKKDGKFTIKPKKDHGQLNLGGTDFSSIDTRSHFAGQAPGDVYDKLEPGNLTAIPGAHPSCQIWHLHLAMQEERGNGHVPPEPTWEGVDNFVRASCERAEERQREFDEQHGYLTYAWDDDTYVNTGEHYNEGESLHLTKQRMNSALAQTEFPEGITADVDTDGGTIYARIMGFKRYQVMNRSEDSHAPVYEVQHKVEDILRRYNQTRGAMNVVPVRILFDYG